MPPGLERLAAEINGEASTDVLEETYKCAHVQASLDFHAMPCQHILCLAQLIRSVLLPLFWHFLALEILVHAACERNYIPVRIAMRPIFNLVARCSATHYSKTRVKISPATHRWIAYCGQFAACTALLHAWFSCVTSIVAWMAMLHLQRWCTQLEAKLCSNGICCMYSTRCMMMRLHGRYCCVTVCAYH